MADYTSTIVQFQAEAGEQVNLTTPSAIITFTPNTGYTLVAADVTVDPPGPPEASSVIIAQEGLNVTATIFFADTFIMPVSDYLINMCTSVLPRPELIGISGNILLKTTLVNDIPGTTTTTIPYSGEGEVGEEITVYTLVLTADSGTIFEVLPLYLISSSNAYPSNYNISVEYATVDSDVTVATYTIKYTIEGTEDIVGDVINFEAKAAEQRVDPGTYNAWTFPNGTNLGLEASILNITVYGSIGAEITITEDSLEAPGTEIVVWENLTPIVGPAPYINLPISLPAIVANSQRTFTMSGDISPTITQANPFIVNRNGDVSVTLRITGIPYETTLTVTGVEIVSGPTGAVSAAAQTTTTIRASATITSVQLDRRAVVSPVSFGIASNLDPALNGGTVITYPANIANIPPIDINSSILFIEATVTNFGTSDIICTLDLTGYVSTIDIIGEILT